MREEWRTVEQVLAKQAKFEAALGGSWRRPAAYGIAHEVDGQIVVNRLNVGGEHPLPAVVLATVSGYRSGVRAVPMTAVDLDQAITLLEPAEACAAWDHPNLWAWRYLREEIGDQGTAVALFADQLDGPDGDDPFVRAFLTEVHRGRQENPDGTTTLWRPVGPAELELLRECGMSAWPPRLPDQPIFYPVLNQEYAATIARDWNVPASRSGYVTRFRLGTSFARRYPTRQAGGTGHLELWIPAEDIDELNKHLVGQITVIDEYP